MVNKILTAARVKHRRGRLTGQKAPTEAVYLDDITTEQGPDLFPGAPLLIRHDITVELYEDKPDDASEVAVEKAIIAAGLHYTKQDRVWIQSEQMYQVLYEFTYYEKRRA